MKKIFLYCIIFCLTKSIFGQVSVGLNLGGNFCKIDYSVDYERNPYLIVPDNQEFLFTSGFTVGIPVEIAFSEKLSLFSDISYLQKGTKTKYSSTLLGMKYNLEGTIKYNYIELPIQVKYYVFKKDIGVFVAGGPSFGYLLNGKSKYDNSSLDLADNTITYSSSDTKYSSNDIKDAGINRFDVSLALSVGVDYKLGIGKVFFNLNYMHGLVNLVDNDMEGYEGIKEYNRGIITTIGYLIPLSK